MTRDSGAANASRTAESKRKDDRKFARPCREKSSACDQRVAAAGFGFALAAAADITIAADTAKFSIPEFNHGIMPTMVMSSMIDRVPLKALMYHVWTSKVISAVKAMEIGAVSEVVPEAELEKTAQAFIDRMLHFKRPAVLAVKEYGVNAQPIDMSKAVNFARSLHAMVNSANEMKRSEGHK